MHRDEKMVGCYTVNEPTAINDKIYNAIKKLLPQYSTIRRLPSYHEVKEIIDSETTRLLLAYDLKTTRIVGSLTLVLFRLPSGIRALIEDVVVDEKHRNKGIGRLLCESAIERSIDANARTIDLTSNPMRKAANNLYQTLGFTIRDTNIYRYNNPATK